MSQKHVVKIVLLGICAQLGVVATAQAGTYEVFSPEVYVRANGAPVAEVSSFQVPDPSANYTLTIYNGGLEDDDVTGDLVSSSVIMMNGTVVVGPGEFDEDITTITKILQLEADNEFSVELRGKPGGLLYITITGEDDGLPTIEVTAPAALVANDQQPDIVVEYSDVPAGVDLETLSILLDGTDITWASVVGPASATYSPPAPLASGAHQVVATISDNAGNSASDTHDFLVNTPPTANDNSVITAEDTAADITLTGGDVDGDDLAFSVTSGPSNGTLSGTAPDLTYTPDEDFNGTDSFTFMANDGILDSSSATVSITVTPVNDPPTADDQSVTTAEDTAVNITLTGSDVEGDALTYSVTSDPSHGVLSGTAPDLIYTPDADFNGMDTFTFTANDGAGDGSSATVSIDVTPVNDPPTADDDSLTTPEDIAVSITLGGDDIDGDVLTYSVTSGPSNGTLSGTAPNLTYTPDADYAGPDAFTFAVDDGNIASIAATVTVTVTPVADTPNLAVADANGITGLPISLSLSASLSDTDGSESLSIEISNLPVDATLSAGSQLDTTTWSLGAADLAGLTVTALPATSGTFVINVAATATETANGDMATNSDSFNLDIFSTEIDLSDIASDGDPRGFAIAGGTSTAYQTYAGDWAGYSVDIVGDFNGDGLAEILVGAPEADPNGTLQKGIAYVVWGKTDGAAIDLDDVISGVAGFAMIGDDGDFDLDALLCGSIEPCGTTTSVGDVDTVDHAWVEGPRGGGLGFDVAGAGDVNGDGFPDLIVSAPYARGNKIYQGKSYVLYGDAYTSSFNVSEIEDNAFTDGFAMIGEEGADPARSGFRKGQNGDLAGWSVDAARDVNGDGLADLLVTARNALRQDLGRTYVVFGTDGTDTISLGELAMEDNDSGFAIIGRNGPNNLKKTYGEWMSSAGDFNRDGYGDVLAHPAEFGDFKSFVVFGSEDFQNVTLQDFGAENLVHIQHDLNFEWHCTQNGCTTIGHIFWGYPVAGGGDINADGYSDVVLSGISEDHKFSIWVILGRAGTTDIDVLDLLSGIGGFRIHTDVAIMSTWKDEISIVGDVNGDGFDDLVIGTSTTKVDGINNVGRTYVVFGKSDLNEVSLEDVANGIGGFVINGEFEGDRAGVAVNSSGDVNGDGLADIVIGAYHADANGNTDSGTAYVVFGADFSGAITHFGGEGDDTLTGTPADDAMVGGRGNDLIIGNGGVDAYSAGAGDDTVRISDTNFRRINGGVGFDVLQLEGDGLVLSLVDSRGLIDGFEAVDLGLPGSQTLEVTKLDLLNLSDNSNELIVFGETTSGGDIVSLLDGGWTIVGNVTIDARSFVEYNNGRAVLLLETTIDSRSVPSIIAQSFNVDENSPDGMAVATITASDLDGVITGFSILSQSISGTFELDSVTGVLSVLNGSQLDFETSATHLLTVAVTDDDGLTSSVTVTIDLNDINEPPTITGLTGAVIFEHSPTGTIVSMVIATDPDAGDSLTFAIISGNDDGQFAIDASSGIITIADNGVGIDFEQNSTLTLVFQVSDSGNLTDTQSKLFLIFNVTTISHAARLDFSTTNRGIFSDDPNFAFDTPASQSTLVIPPGDPVVAGDFTMDLEGEFQLNYDIDMTTGAVSASMPVDFDYSYPDEITPGTPFLFTSNFDFDSSAATMSGNTPGYSVDLSVLVQNLTVIGALNTLNGAVNVEFINQSYSMDGANPFEVSLAQPATSFTGAFDSNTGKIEANGIEFELYDGSIDWDAYLANALSFFSFPTNEGTFTITPFTGTEVVIDYIVYTVDVLGNITTSHDFTLEYNGVPWVMTLEDGSQIVRDLSTPDDYITVPAAADLNADGRVDFSITFEIDTTFRNDMATVVSLEKRVTAGDFLATVTTENPFGDPSVTILEEGPFLQESIVLSVSRDDPFEFTLGGFNTYTITGAFDLEQ